MTFGVTATAARQRVRIWIARSIVAIAVLMAFGGFEAEAMAGEVPFALRPSTRPLFLLFGVGLTAGIGGQCYDGYYFGGSLYNEPGFQTLGCGGALKLSQEFGAHLTGTGVGPAVGVLLQEEVLSYGYFGLTVAPKFSWDIQVVKGLGFYVSPNVAVGYHSSRWQGHPTLRGGDIQGGVTFKLSLGDRALIYTQVPHVDFVFGPGFSMVRYDFIGGVGVSF